MPSRAQQALVKRAVSCSFSSVFHLQKAGMSAKEFRDVSNVFKGIVVAPGLVFAAAYLTKE